ncbi:MAG TPA: hypothetical protein PK141_02415, partial [Polyangiaceae bacterium]|nr:hypothetical protein [Polyangiaceae bacterium]
MKFAIEYVRAEGDEARAPRGGDRALPHEPLGDPDVARAVVAGVFRGPTHAVDEACPLVVRLERGLSIEGTTKDVGGKPIAGVRVFASHRAADWDTVTLTAT